MEKLLLTAQLRKYAYLSAKTDVKTRWSYTYSILERYMVLRRSIENFSHAHVVFFLMRTKTLKLITYAISFAMYTPLPKTLQDPTISTLDAQGF